MKPHDTYLAVTITLLALFVFSIGWLVVFYTTKLPDPSFIGGPTMYNVAGTDTYVFVVTTDYVFTNFEQANAFWERLPKGRAKMLLQEAPDVYTGSGRRND